MAHKSWGSGWPACQFNVINRTFQVKHRFGTTRFPGGIHVEIEELVERLVKETANRGYRFGTPEDPSYGCWGFACRAIAGTSTPSNHSWGLAVDINAPKNPRAKTLKTDMPSWMPDLWNAYMFRWGGDYKKNPDAMHYEFVGSRSDARRMLTLARQRRLGELRDRPPTNLKPSFPGQIRKGSTGEVVKVWQKQFNRKGYGLKVDGVAGNATNHVIRHFQNKVNLRVDGIAGEKTWSKLVG